LRHSANNSNLNRRSKAQAASWAALFGLEKLASARPVSRQPLVARSVVARPLPASVAPSLRRGPQPLEAAAAAAAAIVGNLMTAQQTLLLLLSLVIGGAVANKLAADTSGRQAARPPQKL